MSDARIIRLSPWLETQLRRRHADLIRDSYTFNGIAFARALDGVERTHPRDSAERCEARAAYRLLTARPRQDKPPVAQTPAAPSDDRLLEELRRLDLRLTDTHAMVRRGFFYVVVVLVALFAFAQIGQAQNNNPAVVVATCGTPPSNLPSANGRSYLTIDTTGAICIAGSISLSGADGAIQDGVSGSILATVLDLTSANPLTVAIVDDNGDQILNLGGGTQYTEGDTDATITGTAMLFEGAANALVAAPGTAANGLLVDVSRVTGTVTVSATNLDVQIGGSDTLTVGNVATIGTSVTPGTAAANLGKAEDAAHSSADTGVFALGVRNDSLGTTFTSANGDYSPLAVTSTGVLRVDPSGTTTQPVSVSGSVTVTATNLDVQIGGSDTLTVGNVATIGTSVTPGTAAANLGKAEDAAHSSGDTGVFALAVRNDSLGTTFSGANGDYTPIAVTSTGVVRVDPSGTTTQPVSISGSVTVTDGAGALNVICDSGCSGGSQYAFGAASGATDNATMAGVIRDDALSTLADAEGDVVGLRVTSTGALWVQSATSDAAEDAAVSTNPVPVGGVYRSTLTTLEDGDVGYVALDSSTRTIVVGAGTAGTAAGGVVTIQGVASMTPVLVSDGSGALNVICDSGCSGGTQYAIGAVSGATDTVTMAGAIRDDALTTLADADGDVVGLRVDSTGGLWVTPTGTVTVSGTITANLSATDNAVLDDIADGIPVTNAGTFVVQENGAALTALQLIDDVIYVDDTATHSTGSTKVAGIGAVATPTDATLNANDIGMPGMSVNRELWNVIRDAAGNARGANVNASNELLVACSTCSGSGVSAIDDAAFTVATDDVVPVAGVYQATPDSVDDGDAGALRMTANRILLVDGSTVTQPVSGTITANLSATDNAVLDDIADGIDVTNAGTFAVQCTSGCSGGSQYAIGAVSGATDNATMIGLVRDDALSTLADAEGDVVTGRVDSTGALWVNPGTVTVTATNLDVQIGGSDTLQVGNVATIGTSVTPGTAAANLGKAEDAVVASGDTGIALLAMREDTPTSSAADGDYISLKTDSTGRLYVNVGNTVTVTDGAGALNVICDSGCSGGTQYAEDTATAAGETVTMAGVVRQDTLASLVGADQDRTVLSVTSTGALWVQSATSDAAEDAAVSTNPVPIGGVYRTASVTLDNGDVGYPRIDVDANLQVVGTGTAGSAAGGVLTIQGIASMTPVIISDGSGALNVICDSGCSGGSQYAIGAVSGATDNATMIGLIRDDALSTLADAEGDVVTGRVDSTGALWVNPGTVTVTATNLDVQIGGSDTLQVGNVATIGTSVTPGTAAANLGKAEDNGHSTGDTGVFVLGVRNDSLGTTFSGTDGDYTPIAVTSTGVVRVDPSGTTTQPVSGTVTVTDGAGALNVIVDSGTVTTVSTVTSLSQLGGVALPVEDVAETAAGVGIYAMSVRRDTQASSAGTTGDNATINTDASGNLWITGTYLEDVGETAGGQLLMAGSVRRDTAASSAGTTGDNATVNTDANGYLWSRSADPCSALATTTVPISATADAVLITATASKRNIICGGVIVANAAEIVSIWEGTGSTCGTSSAAVMGSTTEANGLSLAANGGFIIPNRVRGLSANVDTCLRISGTSRVTGYITYVQE